MKSELRFLSLLAAMAASISILIYLVIGNPEDAGREGQIEPLEGPNAFEEYGQMVYSPTGSYVAGDPSLPLALHAFQVTPDYISIVYTLVATPGENAKTFYPTLRDDQGQTYRTLSNAILGSTGGVLAGVLVVEAHISGGSLLTIEASSAEMEGGKTKFGTWSIPFLKTAEPNSPITFIEGGRLSPEEGVALNGARVAIAGPPGSSPIEVLVHRDGNTTSIFGAVDRNGEATALSQGEFEAKFGASGYPKPPGFSSAATSSH